MKIHEYQGKQIFAKYGVPVPKGYPAFTVDEAEAAAKRLATETGGTLVVVKAQIHAGGRGKGGGVKLARSLEDVKKLSGEILGMQLKTHQTGPEGQKVRRLLIEEGADIKKEYYVAAVTDRATQKVAIMASSEGGMDIEEVAHATPEKILKVFVDPATGLTYIALDGDIGCLVNGAGLAMGTMDTIKLAGGEPANFLDVGGGANEEQVKNAFRIILSDKNVRAILINIFGGIMRCDIIAKGVVAAVREMGLAIPVVVRLEGTNVDQGKAILRESGLKITPADGLADGARKVVDAANAAAAAPPSRPGWEI